LNTVLNFIYFDIACELSKVRPVCSLHNGDDMLTTFKTFNDYQKVTSCMKTFGVRLQLMKCAFNSVAEFLRVEYRSGTPKQYLPRAISTMVHGRIESVEHNDVKAIMEANKTRIDEVEKRGFNEKWIYKLVDNADIRLMERNIFKSTDYEVIEFMRNNHPIVGGINKQAKMPIMERGKDIKCVIKVPYDEQLFDIKIPVGIADQARVV